MSLYEDVVSSGKLGSGNAVGAQLMTPPALQVDFLMRRLILLADTAKKCLGAIATGDEVDADDDIAKPNSCGLTRS